MSVEYRPNRNSKPWRARIQTPDGRISKSFRTKADAEHWERSQTVDMLRGEWVDPRLGRITLREWVEEVEASKLSIAAETQKTRRSLIDTHLTPDLGHWPIGNLTPETIQRWVRDKTRRLSPATVHKLHAILSEALTLAVNRGRLLRNPNVAVELPRIPTPDHRYLTETEVLELADAIQPRYRIFVMVGAFGGLRPGETLSLRWGDVDVTRKNLSVRGTKNAASRRTVRLPPILLHELSEHRRLFPHTSLVVHNTRGRTPSIDAFRNRQWKAAVDQSVGEPMRPHDLRHTHVGLLIAQGAHAKAIADRLGHTSIRTTMDTYGHLLEGVEADVVDRIGNTWNPQIAPRREEAPGH